MTCTPRRYANWGSTWMRWGMRTGRRPRQRGWSGRLAACFLDSLSTLSLPCVGCGIRYDYGFFRQEIRNGEQVEVPDNWADDGCIWEIERDDERFEVRFGGTVNIRYDDSADKSPNVPGDGHVVEHRGYTSVFAVPYDMPIIGFDTELPSTLRLWSARPGSKLDLHRFNRGEYEAAASERELAETISKVLYRRTATCRAVCCGCASTTFWHRDRPIHRDSHRRYYGDLHSLHEQVATR